MQAALAAAVLAWAAAPVFAGEAGASASDPPPYAVTFAQLDTNRDGLLSFSECFSNPKLSNAFSVIDTNADGFLSLAEIRAAFGGTVFGGAPVSAPAPAVSAAELAESARRTAIQDRVEPLR